MATRVAAATVGIPIIVILTLVGGDYFYLLLLLASSVALLEYYGLARRKGAAPLRMIGLVAGAATVSTFYYPRIMGCLHGWVEKSLTAFRLPSQWQLLLATLLLFVLVSFSIQLFREKESSIFSLAATFSGVLYVSLPFGTLLGIRELLGEEFIPGRFLSMPEVSASEIPRVLLYRWGGYLVVSIFATIWICDTSAQFVGLRFGKHKLHARVSPNKSWEGAIAGFIAAILAAVASRSLVLPFLTLTESLVIGAVVGTFGQVGDLAESILKRDAEVKDSSSIIPGHGGVLDRFDSLLFVSPILFLYFDFVIF
jgi:phosphatidate cytidylyltransferase